MTFLDLAALAVAGLAASAVVAQFASPKAFMATAGVPGIPLEVAFEDDMNVRTAGTRFGGNTGADEKSPSWASFPRAF